MMQTNVALLRAINVNGHNIIKMAELKKSFEELGFSKVKTYIQSGNVLFKADQHEDEIVERIETGILARFGMEVPVILRTSSEIEKLIANCPYPAENLADGETVHAAFLSEAPPLEVVTKLESYRSETEDFVIDGRNVYLFFRKSFHVSKLPVQFKRLGLSATLRNWRTVNKLVDLAKKMED